MDINAIERVLDKRAARGASDQSLIQWLQSLKATHKYHHKDLDRLIEAIKATPAAAEIEQTAKSLMEQYPNGLTIGQLHAGTPDWSSPTLVLRKMVELAKIEQEADYRLI